MTVVLILNKMSLFCPILLETWTNNRYAASLDSRYYAIGDGPKLLPQILFKNIRFIEDMYVPAKLTTSIFLEYFIKDINE